MTRFLKYIFYISLIFLIIISIYPGSLFGYLLYGDIGYQPVLIKNPYEASINHFIYYFYLAFLGLFIYYKTNKRNKLIKSLFFLAAILEFVHLVIPHRSFEISDLAANIFGVLFACLVIKIYLSFKRL
jgi:hypothetical protein